MTDLIAALKTIADLPLNSDADVLRDTVVEAKTLAAKAVRSVGGVTPWSDLKVCFDIGNPDRFWKAVDAGKVILPKGWEVNETDCAGARCVVLFRVSGVAPSVADGRAVAAQVRRWGR